MYSPSKYTDKTDMSLTWNKHKYYILKFNFVKLDGNQPWGKKYFTHAKEKMFFTWLRPNPETISFCLYNFNS